MYAVFRQRFRKIVKVKKVFHQYPFANYKNKIENPLKLMEISFSILLRLTETPTIKYVD